MYTKNLLAYKHKNNSFKKLITKSANIKIIFFALILMGSFFTISYLNKSTVQAKRNNIVLADFKTDINMLSESANVIEIERRSSNNMQLSMFGADGKLLKVSDVSSGLSNALIKLGDDNVDGMLEDKELSELGIMRLNPQHYRKTLTQLKFNLKSLDRNIKNYVVITKGKYAGTVLYNGSIKFLDDDNKRYFGLELSI
ncbi:hypothetical protein [Clostridium manihotivorum]|uniref:Uncharacterized protein n=1 Tax=Clostridium manihotivorum TaxID=2320868 RepID=A0A3R5QVM4_9CLOT|nr:hypothetical protein [Clostridium manihotivorum]QAA33431.1 hypothetical protein C1I91_18255 [Clostridium manihotivorum]